MFFLFGDLAGELTYGHLFHIYVFKERRLMGWGSFEERPS